MSDLSHAVTKTMNFVFADIDMATQEKKTRLEILKANVGKIANIPIDEIETDQNIRSNIDIKSESFLRLVESIKKYGILENVVVNLQISQDDDNYKLICVAGHRRILAAKVIGNIYKIPCLIQDYIKNGDNVGAALAENLNREDLHCLDIAEGYQSLVKSGWSEEDLANHFCRDKRTIKHYLKMSSWTMEIKKIIRKNNKLLSTRVIMRQFAYRKFASMADLKEAIVHFVESNENPIAKPKVSKRSAGLLSINRSQIRKDLRRYLLNQNTLSSIIKEEIEKAFIELNLI